MQPHPMEMGEAAQNRRAGDFRCGEICQVESSSVHAMSTRDTEIDEASGSTEISQVEELGYPI